MPQKPTFESLPPELRLRIYENLLVVSMPIRILHYYRSTTSGGQPGVALYNDTLLQPCFEGGPGISLLHLNKAISSEALPVLYG
jgi:hypothetical protein